MFPLTICHIISIWLLLANISFAQSDLKESGQNITSLEVLEDISDIENLWAECYRYYIHQNIKGYEDCDTVDCSLLEYKYDQDLCRKVQLKEAEILNGKDDRSQIDKSDPLEPQVILYDPNISRFRRSSRLIDNSMMNYAMDDSGNLKRDLLDINYDEDANPLDIHRMSSSDSIGEWVPIQSTIGSNSVENYAFPINYSSIGLSQSFEIMIFISANICVEPAANNTGEIRIFHTFDYEQLVNQNYSGMTEIDFENGYAQDIARINLDNTGQKLFVSVLTVCDNCTNALSPTSDWSYTLGISQNNLVFQYDTVQQIYLMDTDHESALFQVDSLDLNSSSHYQLYIGSGDVVDTSLTYSWCSTQSLPEGSRYTINKNNTINAISHDLYVINDLEANTTYTAVLVENFSSGGGVIYESFSFQTMSNEGCKLIYDLEFCGDVAYSVPNSESLYNGDETLRDFKVKYDTYAKNAYQNFTYALQQIACDTELDARYSPIRTCADCASSYKNWLCAVTIPRCSSRNLTGYKSWDKEDGRSDFIKEEIKPPVEYFEILPCLNVCQAIVRDCPSDFGFACPEKNDTVKNSYYWDLFGEYASCNYMGDTSLSNSASIIQAATFLAWASFTFVTFSFL
ncbi:hypothetical protein B5S28_g2052 [[Candida] boidinii]|nr:hypothetical protein B5S28_g2052 [[Candida] boidinii]OWB61081.1 hypothetical protein B5S29_g1965 [[Candida] boidinii]